MLNPSKLRIYSQAKELTTAVYDITKKFPADERYGIVSQIRRAAASIGANMAEGCGRESKTEFLRFFNIALGSAHEATYFLEISRNLEYIAETEFAELHQKSVSLSKQIRSFITNARTRP